MRSVDLTAILIICLGFEYMEPRKIELVRLAMALDVHAVCDVML